MFVTKNPRVDPAKVEQQAISESGVKLQELNRMGWKQVGVFKLEDAPVWFDHQVSVTGVSLDLSLTSLISI